MQTWTACHVNMIRIDEPLAAANQHDHANAIQNSVLAWQADHERLKQENLNLTAQVRLRRVKTLSVSPPHFLCLFVCQDTKNVACPQQHVNFVYNTVVFSSDTTGFYTITGLFE